MLSGDQGYCSISKNEGAAASSEDAALLKILDLVADVPN